jgi:hypothetical protein
MLADARWKNVSGRLGTKGIKDKDQQHLPGEEAWLIREHRSSREEEVLRASASAVEREART